MKAITDLTARNMVQDGGRAYAFSIEKIIRTYEAKDKDTDLLPLHCFCSRRHEKGNAPRLCVIGNGRTLSQKVMTRYTVKQYHSKRVPGEDGWVHETVELRPLNPEKIPILLTADNTADLRVIGEFVRVIETP